MQDLPEAGDCRCSLESEHFRWNDTIMITPQPFRGGTSFAIVVQIISIPNFRVESSEHLDEIEGARIHEALPV